MIVGGEVELADDVLPEQRQVGDVAAIGDGQRAAELAGGLGEA